VRTVPPGLAESVSRRHGVSVRAILETNRLSPPYHLNVGQRIILPRTQEHVVRRGDTLGAITSFRTVVDQFPKTSHGAMATHMLAGIFYRKQDYTQAQQYYEHAVNRYGEYDLIKGTGLFGLGSCAIQQGNIAQAIPYFERFLKECGTHHQVPDVMLALAECLIKQNSAATAKETLEKLTESYPTSQQAIAAKSILATL